MPPLTLLPFQLRLPSRSELELAAAVLFVLLFASWLRRGEQIATRDAIIAARPSIESVRLQLMDRDTKKGPSKTTTKTTFDPETGKKLAVEKVKEEGPIESHASSRSEEQRKETPPAPARQAWRAFNLELQPISKHTAARFDADLGSLRLSARHELPFAGQLSFSPWIGVGFRF